VIESYWWRTVPNFGDGISPHLVRWLSGQPVRWSRAAGRPVLAAVGSVVQSCHPGWHIWGSGLIAGDVRIPAGLTVHAVRGPRTRAALASCGYPADVPLGDPALLLPLLFPGRSEPVYDWGIIPHYIDYPLLALILFAERLRPRPAERRRVILINPCCSPPAYIRRLTACRRVAASSLHGLVAADAYGIPNAWFATGRNPLKDFCLSRTTFVHDDFKYFDYLESVGRLDATGTLVQRRIPWDELEEQARRWSRIAWDPLPLLESFPWKSSGWESRVTGPAREYWR